MKNPKQLITLAAIVATCGLLLASCGGGKTSTTTSATQVTAADSPIPNTTGMKIDVDTNISIFALSEVQTANIAIKQIDPSSYQADKSFFYGESFYKINTNSSGIGVVRFNDQLPDEFQVRECDLEKMECTSIAYEITNENTIRFDVNNDLVYALERK